MAEKGFGVKEINLIGASGTPTIESPNNLNLNAVNVAISTNVSIGGTLTVSGNISIGGTLTYEDVTNIDSVGIVTTREGVFIPDNKELKIGNTASSPDLKIYHNTSNTLIENSTGQLSIENTASNISIKASDSNGDFILRVGGSTSSENAIVAVHNGEVILSFNGNTKLTTTNTGVTVTGTAVATTFSGSGASLTNLPAANLTGTLPAISGANLTGIAVTEAPVTDYTITSNGSSAYRFHGGGVDETANNPDLYLIRGQKYRFNNTTGSGHPFAIRVSNGGSAYTDGVSGSNQGIQFFTVPYAAPASLVYQCTIHSGMVGNIYIRGGASTANISNNADNRIITGGSGGNLNGESNLTFDGSILNINASVPSLKLTDSDGGPCYHEIKGPGNGDLRLSCDVGDSSSSGSEIQFLIHDEQKAVITSDGKVGINEDNPQGHLHVENDNAHASTYYLNNDAGILIQNKNSNASAKTVLKLEGPAGGGDCALVYGASATNLIISDRQNERLRISSSGTITTPYQFHIEVQRSGNQTGYDARSSAGGTPVVFNDVVRTRGTTNSALNTSTGKITVPVDGVYFLEASAYTTSGNTLSQGWFTEGSSRMTYSDITQHTNTDQIQAHGMHFLSANTEVGFHPYGATASSITIEANIYHTWFRVTLIG